MSDDIRRERFDGDAPQYRNQLFTGSSVARRPPA